MPLDISEATRAIKKAGSSNVRIVPINGQHPINGLQAIEINENGSWTQIVSGISRSMVDGLIKQATDKLLLG